ncbi:DNA methyltransferase [Anopheles sinensis]|uniref:DNA methyltransferase n=1 Tax=Anopheles sinensis TaxID=74873 RepID=A0A084WT14_ANOSI|nr:DNA methyltransferase [Anopheles sinensis]
MLYYSSPINHLKRRGGGVESDGTEARYLGEIQDFNETSRTMRVGLGPPPTVFICEGFRRRCLRNWKHLPKLVVTVMVVLRELPKLPHPRGNWKPFA